MRQALQYDFYVLQTRTMTTGALRLQPPAYCAKDRAIAPSVALVALM